MYQTVGQDAIELVAGALGVPLFRRTIHGSAIEQGGEYGRREGRADFGEAGIAGDETEDMFALLSEVKAAHPDVQGVSVGAILSNYQRVRVDHVCQRLSLTPLCYLWQRNQRELMSEMIKAGVEAILIKVAGIGLQERHLGKTLAQMEPTLHKLHGMYGAHICGEGGEYETLTLDCPAFKRRISIKETKTIVHSDHAFATVAYLEVTDAALEGKPERTPLFPTIPPMLDETALRVQVACSEFRDHESAHETTSTTSSNICIKPNIRVVGSWAYISDVQGDCPSTASVEDEVVACFKTIKELLSQHDMHLKHIINITLLLSSMDLFPQINVAYGQYFGTSPPSRACVAVDLPPPTRVRIACVAFRDEESGINQRTGLHVQGVSYWAPANIGPYSQAIIVQDQIFVSGQIGLIPARMALPSPPSFATEAALAFQHADRILAALKDGPTSILQGAVIWIAGSERLELGRHAWDAYSQERSVQDIPAIVVAAKTLPKGAMIEVQVLAHSNRQPDQDEVDDSETLAPATARTTSTRSEHCTVSTRTSRDKSSFSMVLMRNQGAKTGPREAAALLRGRQVLSVKLFHTPGANVEQLSSALDGLACTHIPARGIITPDRQPWDVALCVHSVLCNNQ
ncbi:hypothetical protein FS749_012764 [Ceratobasidium sp. UAMH 11750]|nr:hypothetical protein FS749_012764 [Ceratobasidium sp. UAMH 11750]